MTWILCKMKNVLFCIWRGKYVLVLQKSFSFQLSYYCIWYVPMLLSSGPCWNCAQGARRPWPPSWNPRWPPVHFRSPCWMSWRPEVYCRPSWIPRRRPGAPCALSTVSAIWFFFIPYLFSSLKLYVTISPGQPPERPGFQQTVGCG